MPGSQGLVQPNIIKLSNHRFVAFFRSRYADWIYRSTSSDGCFWTAPIVTQVPNDNSSFQIALLKNGHLVLAFNNSNEGDTRDKPRTGPRWPLSIALSADGGDTWPWVRDIQTGDEPPPADPGDRREYSYPSVLQTTGGTIHLAYTFRRKTIKDVTFDEKWIRQGSSVGKFKGDRHPSWPAQ